MKIMPLLLLVLLLFFSNTSFAQIQQSTDNSGMLTIIITGLDNNKGDVKVGLFNSVESFEGKEKKLKGAILEIDNKRVEWLLKDIPYGEYAVKAFHDEDGDDKIDTNFLGIPTESYGFSNNVMGLFGPPDFEDAKFLFNSDEMQIEIKF